jgi:hypothetical protein
VTLTLDKVVRTKSGFIPGIKLLQVLGDVGTSVLETKKRETIDVMNLHKILGHCGEVNARFTGKAYGYEVPANLMSMKHKNINKEWKGGSSICGECLYILTLVQ